MNAPQHRTMSAEMDSWLDAQLVKARQQAQQRAAAYWASVTITDEELYHLSIG